MNAVQQNIPSDDTETKGWQAHLALYFSKSRCRAHSRTIIERSQHYGPLRVQRPFYPENNLAHVYIIHPPGGVVGGDQLNISLNVTNDAQVLSTTPGSGKYYLSAGRWAILEQHLRIEAGASLEWLPQENILFPGARFHARTRIELQDDATFIGWDVSCLGRPMSHERFEQGAFDSRLEFYHNQKLLLVENQRVVNKRMLMATAGLRNQPVQATLLAFPCDNRHLEKVRNKLDSSPLIAATLIDGLLVVRALGSHSEILKQQLISVWQVLRPILLDRPAVLPRIWAT